MGLSVSFPEGPDEWAWPEADDITMFVENGLGDLLGFDRVVCCEHVPRFDNDMKNLRFNKFIHSSQTF